MHFDFGFKRTYVTKWDKEKRPVLEVKTNIKYKLKRKNVWNNKKNRKREQKIISLSTVLFFSFSEANSDFSSSFLFWLSSIFCCPCRKSAWFISETKNFNNLLPSSTNFSTASIRWFKRAMASSTLFKSSARFFCRLWKNNWKCLIVTLNTTPFY